MRRYYGLDLWRAEADGVPAGHVADLVAQLPADCAVNLAEDPGAAWGRTDVLLAMLINAVVALQWGLAGAKGHPPVVGPSWLREARRKRLTSRHMTRGALDAQLARFAQAAREGKVSVG